MTTTARVALLGNPNTGKTTVFNRLCGARAKTANFPGTTTSARVGRAKVGGDLTLELLDLPGIYELGLQSPEAGIVRDVLSETDEAHRPDTVLVIVDASNLSRNLVLVGEVLSRGFKPIICLNMIDVAARRGWTIDAAALARQLGVPVVPTVAPKGIGLDQLRATLLESLNGHRAEPPAPVDNRYDPVVIAEAVIKGRPAGEPVSDALT